jgi:hypothetical protein
MTDETLTKKLPLSLLILRLSLVLFLLPWVIEKFTKPEQTGKIFAHFYHIDALPIMGSYAIGGAWVLLLLAFATGYKKRISYFIVMALHGIGTVFTWPQLLPFLETHNHLFLAALPTLGGLIVLYRMRDYDTLLSVSKV